MTQLLGWFGASGVAVLVSALLSLAAIVISLLALRISRKALRIEEARERDRLANARRAALRARIIKSGSIESLLIENTGPAEARGIEIHLDGKPYREHAVAIKGETEIGRLGPNSHARVPMMLAHGGPGPPFDLVLTWEDDSGEPGSFRTTLTY